MITTLDYPGVDLKLYADTETEVMKRAGACEKEPETIAFLESMEKGSVFFDIGANVGSYTLIAAALGLKVIAFEASTPNFERLKQNLELNDLGALLIPDPLWKCEEQISFCYSSREPGAALHSINGQSPDREMMKAYPLDWWVFPSEERIALPQPRYLKLDVDGAELEVLEGAQRTLRGVERLQVEVDHNVPSHRAIRPLLEDWGFDLEMVHPHGRSSVANIWFTRH